MEGDESLPLLVSMTAGCIAGAIEATATWPMEYIKTQLQLQEAKNKTSLLEGCGSSSSCDYDDADGIIREPAEASIEGGSFESLPFTNMTDGFVYTVKTHGCFALYYGLTPTLIGSIPKVGIRFGCFALFSGLLRSDGGTLTISMLFFAGLLAGAVEALLVVVPVETIKTKCIQLKLPLRQGLREIFLMQGIRGMYEGVVATVMKQSSNHGLRFLWYYEYKRFVTHDGRYVLTPIWAFLGGMTAGIFSALGNQPVDVIKTKMQGVRVEYTSTWDCIYQTSQKEGIAGFYTGILPRLSRVIPGQGIIFMSFEIIATILMAFWY